MKTALAYREEFLDHETGQQHPENYQRLVSIINKIKSTSYYSELIQPEIREATEDEIATIHSSAYIKDFQKRVKQGVGYFDGDTPYSSGSFKAATLASGSGIALADVILRGEADNGIALVRPPGHHAEKYHAMGFCMFNNIAITAKYLQSKGIQKIFILDWDVHHGNGTENSFYADDTVFFASTHQYPFYPGSGAETDIGTGKGKGFNLNIPLSRGSSNEDYLNAFTEKIVPAIDRFQPDFILVSAGFDAHKDDPLGGMNLTSSVYERFTDIIRKKAEEHCKGKLISFLEGGYNLSALADSVEAHIAALKS
ncbi:MAG TPA: histone deacetylase [Leptospiraceae bacterium]|nr:histone deacetylase [Leptospiraceae bacterium]HMW06577.1 histone deacetylase [Leptospiraceae bacterium]HMX32145.1 histone deacetylase [Leptospiraceae bacterium]HMY31232.1 histone deacetylase [Leptospiraceae bacterium]HMZ63281.1 histone deacetylase [Leptospiraceae bacterium]